jgi:APA family basic amino acid/polyamine antiporter
MDRARPEGAGAGAPDLLRTLGSWEAAAIVVGTIIGSGIFLVPKAMVQNVGTPGNVLLVWLAGGLLSLFGALTYAELAAALPQAGGEYVYLREAYGPLCSFLYGWTQFAVAKSGSIAAFATAFVYYLGNFFPHLEGVLGRLPLPIGPGWQPLVITYGQICAMGLILSLGVVNYFGVRLGGRIQVHMTALKVGLIVVLAGAIGIWGAGSAQNFQTTAPAVGGLAGWVAALVAALWAYDGWNNVNMVSSEVLEPQRNIPRALILGTLGVLGLYLVANLAYFFVLTAAEVAASDRVAAAAARKFLGPAGGGAVALAAMISIFAALNGSILTGSRIPFAMARDGYFPDAVARVHPVHRSPHVSIAYLCGWAAILTFSGRFEELYTYVIFASWILYGLTTASVFVLRWKRPDLPRPYRTIGYPLVPAFFVAAAIFLVIVTLIKSPRESGLGLVVVALGSPFYLYWKRRQSLF